MSEQAKSTDRELWREKADDYYSPSIHVTERGGVGINVGGRVVVRSLRDWHAGACAPDVPPVRPKPTIAELEALLKEDDTPIVVLPDGSCQPAEMLADPQEKPSAARVRLLRNKGRFQAELCNLINKYSMENGSNTPDFILSKYLVACLDAFNEAVTTRSQWYAPEKPPCKNPMGST